MGQIYKVFINNKALTIIQSPKSFNGIWDWDNIVGLIHELEDGLVEEGTVYTNEPERVWKKILDMHDFIIAAGGVVYNEEGKILIIERLGKWDLPKGKLEEGEDIPTCAVREVIEECGVENLTLGEALTSTYHTYPHKGKRTLKKTYWYRMKSSDKGDLTPQAEEDISQALWINPSDLNMVLENTYASIAELLKEEMEWYRRNSL